MWEEVCAGETEAMRDRRIGSSTDSPRGHQGTIPMPRPDHRPTPTMTAADKKTENTAEYAPITRPWAIVRRRPSERSPPLATIIAAVRMTERWATVYRGEMSRIISVRMRRIPATRSRYCHGFEVSEG